MTADVSLEQLGAEIVARIEAAKKARGASSIDRETLRKILRAEIGEVPQ